MAGMFYHPAKANVVADVLSRKSRDDEITPKELMDLLSQQFAIVQIDKGVVWWFTYYGSACGTTT
jgi:hypothetical protein